MTISISALKALVASGATMEAVVAFIESEVATHEAAELARRQKEAARKRRSRLNTTTVSADVRGCPRMSADPSPSPSPPITPYPSPPSDVRRGGDAREEPHFRVTPEALAFADEIAVLCGQCIKDPTWTWVDAQPGVRAQMWLNEGWQIPVMREAATVAVRRKRDGPPASVKYFEKIFRRAHAPQLPLPVLQVVKSDPEVVHVHQSEFRSRARGGESLAARSLRLARSSGEA